MTQTITKQTTPSVAPVAPTPRAVTPRPACSLAQWEGAWAFAAAAGAWRLLTIAAAPTHPPAWLLFVLCNLAAASALAARRFVRRDATRGVSRIGYAALAFPFAQAVLLVIFFCASVLWSELPVGALLYALAGISLFVSLPAHFAVSGAATENGIRHKDRQGDMFAAPLFLAWYGAIFLLIAR